MKAGRLKHSERAITARDFRRVYARGRRARRDGVTVVALRRDDPSLPTRVGLTVPAAVGPAVVRNRIRRRLRAAAAAVAPPRGVDLVLGADRRVAREDFQVLVDYLRRALTDAGVEPAR
ncbi:MAG: ribonuclease P protein component [Actinomycetota bacterium]|nr:ribonuclease P protein component [Actinomycetota bacterium]